MKCKQKKRWIKIKISITEKPQSEITDGKNRNSLDTKLRFEENGKISYEIECRC